jgi:hypothetical protein
VTLASGHAIAATVVLGGESVPDGGAPDYGACGPGSDGRPCGLGDLCHDVPVCVSGVCTPMPKPDGTSCGNADACHNEPACVGGVCMPRTLADGTECAPTTNPCKEPGRCDAGVCGPITDKPSGTVCSPKVDACHTDGLCNATGTCGAQGVRPDGYRWGGNFVDRCCGGRPVQVNTASNCGACGINCNGGACQVYWDSSTAPARRARSAGRSAAASRMEIRGCARRGTARPISRSPVRGTPSTPTTRTGPTTATIDRYFFMLAMRRSISSRLSSSTTAQTVQRLPPESSTVALR